VVQVSIPRSEFWSFGHDVLAQGPHDQVGFNSSVGILVVRTGYEDIDAFMRGEGFNSSVGILVVRTLLKAVVPLPKKRSFNSSVGILVVRTRAGVSTPSGRLLVSIPRSEFWSFGRNSTN